MASNRDEEIDRALHTREAILNVWGVNVAELKQAGELLKSREGNASAVINEELTDEEIDKNLSISHVACLWDVRMKIKQQKDELTKDEMLELIDEMASEILKTIR